MPDQAPDTQTLQVTQPSLFSTPPQQQTSLFSGATPDEKSVGAPTSMGTNVIAMAATNVAQPQPQVMNEFQQKVQDYTKQIQDQGSDQQARTQVAASTQLQTMQMYAKGWASAAQDPGIDPQHLQDIEGAYGQVVNQGIEQRATYAAEEKAVQNIEDLAASGDETQAKMVLNNYHTPGGAEQVIADVRTKQLVLQRLVESQTAVDQGSGWMTHLTNFVVSNLPYFSNKELIGNVDLDTVAHRWYDSLFAGQRLHSEAAALYNLPNDQFADYVQHNLIPNVQKSSSFLGFHNQDAALNILSTIADAPPAWRINAQAGFTDGLALLPEIKSIGMVKSIPSLLMGLGARKEASELVANAAANIFLKGSGKAVEEQAGGLTQETVAEEMSNTAQKPFGASSNISVQQAANDSYERGRAALATAGVQASGRWAPGELQKAQQVFEQQLASKYGRELQDVGHYSTPTADGSSVTGTSFFLGKKNGDLFATEQSARKAAKDWNRPDANIVQDQSGQYSVWITENMPETGFYTTKVAPRASSSLSAAVLNPAQIGDNFLHGLSSVAQGQKQKILNGVLQPLAKQFSSLGGVDRTRLAAILEWGEKNGTWLNDSDANILHNRAFQSDMSPKALEAYHGAQRLGDIDFALRRDDVWKHNVINNYKTVSFDTGQGPVARENGQVYQKLDSVPSNLSYDIKTGTHYDNNNPLTPAKKAELESQGRVAVSLQEGMKLNDGNTVKHFIMDRGDLNEEELRRDQLGYTEGGHRIYDASHFVKQTQVGVNPSDGKSFLKNPGVFIAGNKAETEFWASKMEQVRELVKAGSPTAGQINDLIDGHPGFLDGPKMLEAFRDGTFDVNHPFLSLADRKMPAEYSTASTSHATDLLNPDETPMAAYLRTNGGLYYGAKGTPLPDWRGEQAPVLDPYQTLNRSMQNIASLSSFSDYKQTSIARWVNTYKQWLDHSANDSDVTVFGQANYSKSIDSAVRVAAEAQRKIIQDNLGWRTPGDLEAEDAGKRFADWVQGSEPGTARNKLATQMSKWWTTQNPLAALRGFAFDAKIGMLNPVHFFMRLQTMANAVLLSPGNGFRGMVGAMPLRAYLTQAGTEGMLDQFAKNGLAKLADFDSDAEMKMFMRSAKSSGFFDFGGTHLLINDYGPNAAASGFKAGWDSVSQAGRFMVNEGETLSRATAYRIGWEEAKEQFPGLAFSDPQFRRVVMDRADAYSMRMSGNDAAAWQKGLASIPTQFWSYNARNLEALLGRDFTTAQKLRLAVGQAALYGSAGVPGVGLISEYFKQRNGSAPNLDSAWGLADRGILDEMVYHLTGADALVGKRIGTGDWATQVVGDVLGTSSYGVKTTAELAGGATFSIYGNIGSGLLDLAHYASSEQGTPTGRPLTRDSLLRLASNISTFGNAYKGYMAYKYGILNPGTTGTVLANDLPTSDAFTLALGFQPGETDEVDALYGFHNQHEQHVKDTVKLLKAYEQQYAFEPDRRQEISDEISTAMSLLPPDIRAQAQKELRNSRDQTTLQAIARQVSKDKVNQQQETPDAGTRESDGSTPGQP